MTHQAMTRRALLGAGAAAGIGAIIGKPSTLAAPAAIQGDPVTLRFMTHNTLEKPAGDVLKEIIAEFEAENPNIKIQIEEVPNADILTKLTAYAEGDDLPDVIDGQFGLASFINLDAALDITEMVDAEGLRESFIPVALQAGTDGEGRILGLPFYTGTDALYYRLDHFEEAGLDPAVPPTTWAELAEAAQALTNPRAGRYGFGMYGKTHTVRCIHFMQNNGPDGEMLRLDRDSGIWTILVNSPESIEAIEYMVSLARDLKVVPPNVVEMDYPANVAAFSAGNISMLTTGPWGAQTFIGTNPEIEGKFGVALHPTPDGEPPILRQGSLIYAIEYMVSLARDLKVVPPNVVEMDYPANVAAFSAGNISMLTTGPWGAQTFIGTNPEIEGKFGVALHPTPDGEPPILRQGSLIYAIGRTTEHPEEAFRFLKWFTHDRQPYFAANAKYGPTTLAALEDPAIVEDPFLSVFLEQSQTAVVEPYEVELGDWNKLKDQFDPEWQAALIGSKDVPTAMNTAATRFAEILGERGELKYPVS